MRQHYSYPFAPIQILTGDIREVCSSPHSRLHDERRSLSPKSCIERRFESSPESRGSQTSGVLPVLFVQAKRINPFPLRESFEVFQTLNQRTNPKFSTNKIKSFAASRFLSPPCGGYLPTFCRTQKVGQKIPRPHRGGIPAAKPPKIPT